MRRNIEKILVIQTAFLGDVVLTIPLLNALRKNFANAHIAVLVIPQTKEIIEVLPAINEIIMFDKKNSQKSWSAFFQLVKKIKQEAFDAAVLPHRSFKSALLAYLAGIPLRIGFTTSQGAFLLTDKIRYRQGIDVHEIERNLDLLVPITKSKPAVQFDITVSKKIEEEALELLRRYHIKETDLVVGINPGSVWPTKRFPPEKYAALADELIRTLGAKVVIIGSAADKSVADRMQRAMKEPVVNVTGMATIKQTISLMRRFRILITNDCGALHIGTAMNVPTVAVFGPTTRALGFYPYNSKDIVVEKTLPCRPCGKHGHLRCPRKNFACMELITVTEIVEAVKKRLAV